MTEERIAEIAAKYGEVLQSKTLVAVYTRATPCITAAIREALAEEAETLKTRAEAKWRRETGND